MRRILFIFTLLFFLTLLVTSVSYGQDPPDNIDRFVQLQLELAGDPANWQQRVPNQNREIELSQIKPHWVFFEEEAYHDPESPTFDTEPTDPFDKEIMDLVREVFDADSQIGEEERLASDRFTPKDDHFFDPKGDYIVETTETTEVGKIKSIYNQITSTVTRSGVPERGDSAAWCLSEGVGLCRHMSAILQESFEEVGIQSQLITSRTHVWVRVTLTEGQYNGITVDLDPMWYQQPIPLPPRSTKPLAKEWRNLMLAILEVTLSPSPSVSVSPSPTPSISVTPTPTLTPTPTPTFTPTPTLPSDDENSYDDYDDSSNNTNSSDYNQGPGGPFVVPR